MRVNFVLSKTTVNFTGFEDGNAVVAGESVPFAHALLINSAARHRYP
jgi:hypothetical protein